MSDSIRIGSVLGITIRVHFLFLGMMGVFLLLSSVASVLALLLLFGLVLLHELGHSLVARRFGIRVLDITFWPLGGMARMSEIPEDTRVEATIAIAGPAVNFALAGIALPVFFATGADWSDTVVALAHGVAVAPAAQLLFVFIAMNLLLGGFNLLPAFPMDGGRVLRALLGRRGDWVGATETAVRVGRVLAVVFFVAAFPLRNWFLPLIALFVWWAGARELFAVRLRHAVRAGSPFGFAPPGGPSGAGTDPLAALFGRRPPPSGPPPAPSPDGPPPQRVDPGNGSSGFSDADVERMERFHGRLRRPR